MQLKLKAVSFLQEAVLIGDARHFCVVLFCLDPENFGEWARKEGIPAEPAHPRVREVLDTHVKRSTGASRALSP